jgi:flagellar biosynthesis protein FlhF
MTSMKFVGKTSREVLHKVKEAFGPDALILSNRPFEGGIELTAMSSTTWNKVTAPPPAPAPAASPRPAAKPKPVAATAKLNVPVHGTVSGNATDRIVQNLMREMTSMKALLQRELSGMAWAGLKQGAPARAAMMQVLLGAGFTPALARELVAPVPERAATAEARRAVAAEISRRLRVLGEETLVTAGGVYALIGPTGVGKTTTIAKLAARCVVRYGAASVGLITTDSYRIAAHDQLRVYGKILGVPVHAVKDAGELVATIDRLQGKKTVLIDTVGMSQRDRLVGEQSAMLAACGPQLRRLLLLNATANCATLDEVVSTYARGGLYGSVVTKLDESANLAAVLDCAMRHRLTLHYVTNGQNVPEDIHLPNPDYLVDRALRTGSASDSHALKEEELSLAVGGAYG